MESVPPINRFQFVMAIEQCLGPKMGYGYLQVFHLIIFTNEEKGPETGALTRHFWNMAEPTIRKLISFDHVPTFPKMSCSVWVLPCSNFSSSSAVLIHFLFGCNYTALSRRIAGTVSSQETEHMSTAHYFMKTSGGDLRYVWVESHLARDSRKTNKKEWDKALQGGAPQVISWCIIPLTIVISTINHSYWSYKPTERYLGGTTNRMLLHSKHPKQLAMLEPSKCSSYDSLDSLDGGKPPRYFQGPKSSYWILLVLTVMAIKISSNWLFQWDYTFYKWGYKYL